MPTYEYKCDKDECNFIAEEFFSIAERDRPVGTECPVENCCGKVVRAVTTPHMQDVEHTMKNKLSKGVNNPTGQMREKFQQMVSRDNKSLGIKQKRALKEKYNL